MISAVGCIKVSTQLSFSWFLFDHFRVVTISPVVIMAVVSPCYVVTILAKPMMCFSHGTDIFGRHVPLFALRSPHEHNSISPIYNLPKEMYLKSYCCLVSKQHSSRGPIVFKAMTLNLFSQLQTQNGSPSMSS